MTQSLEQLREQLRKQQGGDGNTQKSSGGGDNALYRFWDAKNDTTTVVRFLPDKDQSNPFFWVERQVVNLTFDGIMGDTSTAGKTITVQVPCMKMYDHTLRCPIREEINKYWKTDKEDLARKYWPKRSYLMQGFVREGAFEEENSPENPIRRFTINKMLFKNIQSSLLDPEMESMPTDYDNGTDFRIIKTQQGEYANYSTSTFARRESALTDAERQAIETHGLYDLKDFLPNKPTQEGIDVIEEMFFASLEGQPYDPRWSNHYKPYGYDFSGNTATQSANGSNAQTSTNTESSTTHSDPVDQQEQPQQASNSNINSPDSVLAQLRAKVQNGNS